MELEPNCPHNALTNNKLGLKICMDCGTDRTWFSLTENERNRQESCNHSRGFVSKNGSGFMRCDSCQKIIYGRD